MDTIEIRDEEIDVEEIMRKIRENIRKRKESGTITEEVKEVIEAPLGSLHEEIQSTGEDLQHILEYINSNYDIRYDDYSISSHRKFSGPFLMKGRELVHGEVKRYVDVIVAKQTELNANISRALIGLSDKIADIKNELDKKDTTKLDIDYYSFEEKYRGSFEEIKQRQSIYVEYFLNSKDVLDIGCGRGEFLELLKEKGIKAYGVDINEDMVQICQKKGLDVQKTDSISYLRSIKNKSLGGVFSAQVIEHLHPNELIELIKVSYQKMKPGAYFVAETINPSCLSVFAGSFYVDLSHVKPVHPETIKFLIESAGFQGVEFKFISPFPEERKLQKFEIDETMSKKEKKRYNVMNQNIGKLNILLYGYQDYAVIAKR